MRDFSLVSYEDLLVSIQNLDYPILSIEKYIEMEYPKAVFIRHDVDRKPLNSLKVAKLENSLGISTTYYFRYVGSSNNLKIIEEIKHLGHEIGYHYETLSLANGDFDLAIELFSEQLSYFRKIAPIVTVSMHGSPLSKYNNFDIWKVTSPEKFQLNGDVFKTIDYSDVYYLTDTGRAWNSTKNNLRDRPENALPHPADVFATTESLINFLKKKQPEKVSLTTHPERWEESFFPWMIQLGKDESINLVKRIINKVRNY